MSFEWTITLFAVGFSIFVFVIGFTLWLFERKIDQVSEEARE